VLYEFVSDSLDSLELAGSWIATIPGYVGSDNLYSSAIY